jgi:hypothetical protein
LNHGIVIQIRIGVPSTVVDADATEDLSDSLIKGKQVFPILLRRYHVDQTVTNSNKSDFHTASSLAFMKSPCRFDHSSTYALKEAKTPFRSVQQIGEERLSPQAPSIVEYSLPIDVAFNAPVLFGYAIGLSQKVLKQRILVKVGRLEPIYLVCLEVKPLTDGPSISTITNRDTVNGGHTTGTINACQKIRGFI